MTALLTVPRFRWVMVALLIVAATFACVALYLRQVEIEREQSCIFGGYDPESVPYSRRATRESIALSYIKFEDKRYADLAEVVALQYLRRGEIDLYILYKENAAHSLEECHADPLSIADKRAHLAILRKKFHGLENSLDDRETALDLAASCAGKAKYHNKSSMKKMLTIWNKLHSPKEQAKSGEEAWYLFQDRMPSGVVFESL